jgi:hypothetical protein
MRRMYNLYYVMLGLSVSVLGCMLHALINRRWTAIQGGAPLLFAFVVLALVFNAAR